MLVRKQPCSSRQRGPWVTTESGRKSFTGQTLVCVNCAEEA